MFFCADSNVPDRLRAALGLSSPYNFVYGGSWRGRGRCPPCSSPGMRTGKEDKVNILGICAADLLNTLEYNLTCEGDDSRFQRAVVYHRLPESVAREFESISKEKTSQLLVELNQWLAEKKRVAKSDSGKKNNKRIGLGIYSFEEVLPGSNNNKQ